MNLAKVIENLDILPVISKAHKVANLYFYERAAN